MPDFSTAFEEGLRAAGDAQRVKAEVDALFRELEKQLLVKTDGKIKIYRDVVQPKYETQGRIGKHGAIVAKNLSVADSPVEWLASWSQDPRGFPCMLEWGNAMYVAQDLEALQQLLLELLSDFVVGQKLFALIHLNTEQAVA